MRLEKCSRLLLLILGLISPAIGLLSDSQIAPSKYLLYQYDAKSLLSKLQRWHDDQLFCVKSHGINPDSFYDCCGSNYSLLMNSLLNQYKIIQSALIESFVSTVKTACEYDAQPCISMISDVVSMIPTTNNTYSYLAEQVEHTKTFPGVNNELLDIALSQFKRNYLIYIRSRAVITSELFDTVQDIQNFFHGNGVDPKVDYITFNPEDFLKEIGVIDESDIRDFGLVDEEESPQTDGESSGSYDQTLALTQTLSELTSTSAVKISDSPQGSRPKKIVKPGSNTKFSFLKSKLPSVQKMIEAVESEVDDITYPLIAPEEYKFETKKSDTADFNKGLLTEVDSRDKISYLISQSAVDKRNLDLTKVPTEVLNDIKSKKLLISGKYLVD
jgi:hypothetical protein